jgi:hypothetical protein
MRASTVLAVGFAGIVAVAAIVSGVRGAGRGGGDSPAATTSGTASASAVTTSTAAIPVGDLRRLPTPEAGAYAGLLVAFDALSCEPTRIVLATMTADASPGPPTCSIWPSPAGRRFARTGPPGLEEVLVATSPETAGADTGFSYAPGARNGALTVTDDGSVAICGGASVRVWHDGRTQTPLAFTPVDGVFEERCVTGALGTGVVRLGDDRRSLVDVRTRRVVRRLAEPVGVPLAGLISSPDGLVMALDITDGTPQGTVYAEDGSVVVPRLPLGNATRFRKLLLARGGGAVALLTARGWQITNLRTGLNITAPGGTRITDVAFSPDGASFVATTEVGILFAAVRGLAPTALLPGTFQAVVWLPA